MISVIDPVRKIAAEFIGTAFLLLAVVGSAWAAAELSPNDAGLRLLQNSLATAAALIAIIIALFAVSGAQINPAVTLANWLLDRSDGTARRWLRHRPVRGGLRRMRPRQRDVRRAGGRGVHARPGRLDAHSLRSGRDLRAGAHHLRGGQVRADRAAPVRRWGLYRRSLFLHLFDVVRQPGRHDCADRYRFVRGNRPGVGTGFPVGQIIGAVAAVAVVAFLLPKTAPAKDRPPA